MENYVNFAETNVDTTDKSSVTAFYEKGYLFTRKAKGNMYQTRSLRVVLAGLNLNSENRRVLRKFPKLTVEQIPLPILLDNYDWKIHKMGKDFYEGKFGKGIFSAAKLRTLLTNVNGSNFNYLLRYRLEEEIVGYAVTYMNASIFHYAYPFYEFRKYPQNLGMAMMIRALLLAQKSSCSHAYLGSIRNNKDIYKLQFDQLEWFDGQMWQKDIEQLKQLLKVAS